MKKILAVSCLIITALVAIGPLSSSEQASAQMNMNPNLTSRNGMKGGMMNNPSMMTGMFEDQNITGSIKLFPTMMNAINSQIKVSLSDAIILAQKEVGNTSKAIAAHLGVENGYLVYFTWTVDTVPPIFVGPGMVLHKVIIDPGNGKILSSQNVSMTQMMNMLNPNMMGMMGGMMNPMMARLW
jgi:hypothetical protein